MYNLNCQFESLLKSMQVKTNEKMIDKSYTSNTDKILRRKLEK